MIPKRQALVAISLVLALCGIVAMAQTEPVAPKQTGHVDPTGKPQDKPAVKPANDKPKQPATPPQSTKTEKQSIPLESPSTKPSKEAETRQKVEGRVVNKNGKGIGDIEVVALRDGRTVGGGKTEKGEDLGAFSFEIPSGAPVSLRFLRQPEYDPAVILQLSGLHSQNITQVVYHQGEERSKTAELATKMAEEFLAK